MVAAQKEILIVADIDEDNIVPITFELLSAARKIAEDIGGLVSAAVMGNESQPITTEIASHADRVYCITDMVFGGALSDFYAESLVQLCDVIRPTAILLGHTSASLDLALKLNCRLDVPMISDCVGFSPSPDGKHLACIKPVYGDNAVATFRITKEPWMATLRKMAMEPESKRDSAGELVKFMPDLGQLNPSYEIIETIKDENTGLDKADAIVAGGRGIKNVQDFSQLESLIGALEKHFQQVEMGGSRPVIDSGWLPSTRQIGLTGEKVKPNFYIAVGISGALQHLSGIFGAKTIIAINNDPNAQIFNYADLGVVGDYRHVLPSLVKGLKEVS